jgi:myo-inositol-1(or 4)-monophosphatase
VESGNRLPSGSDLRAGVAGIFRDVRAYLLADGRSALEAQGKNPKGDTQLAMDKRADEMAVEGLRNVLGSFQLYSEEQGVVQVGEHPEVAVILDPVDGSTNFARGVRSTGFAVAIMDGTALDLSKLRFGLFGDVFHGDVYSAVKGEGAEHDGVAIRGSQRRTLHGALVCLNATMAQHAILQKSGALRGMSGLRWCGAAVLDTGYVADGGYDAFLELRGGLTPENFAASALVIQEAGGVVTDRYGKPLGPMSMTRGQSVIAAGNPHLHRYIVTRLHAHVPMRAQRTYGPAKLVQGMFTALKRRRPH